MTTCNKIFASTLLIAVVSSGFEAIICLNFIPISLIIISKLSAITWSFEIGVNHSYWFTRVALS